MMKKPIATAALLTVAISVALQSFAEDSVDATNTLPDAKPGECFAKVIVPAVFETTSDEVVVTPGKNTIEIVPATFDPVEKDIEIKPSYSKLKAVPAKYRSEMVLVEIEPSRNEWVTSLGKKGIPASPALLVAAKTGGIDIDGAIAGQCYREYFIPASFEQTDKQVEIKEASSNIVIKGAEFEQTDEIVTSREGYTVKKLLPAVYEKVKEQIEIEPAKSVWKKGTGLVERIDNTTGEIMCLVKVPAKYNTLVKTVLKTEASITESNVPAKTRQIKVTKLISAATSEKEPVDAEFTTVTTRAKVTDAQFSWHGASERTGGTYTGNQICLQGVAAKHKKFKKLVLDTPATVTETQVPAVTKTVKVEKVSTVAEAIRTPVPALTKTVALRKKVTSEKLEWRRVLCQTNMTKGMNENIQRALKEAGYYSGPIDGSIGRGTMNAVSKYQKDKDLPHGGLTIKVLESLGVM